MTKFGEEFRFPAVPLSKFYCLPVTTDQKHFIVNVGRNAVSLAKIHEQKFLQTWTLKHPYSFSCPVAYDQSSSSLYCVANQNVLIAWSCVSENLENSVKHQILKNVFAVISKTNVRPLVVFNDGTCCTLEYVLSDPEFDSSTLIDVTEELRWVDAAIEKDTVVIFCLVQNKKTNCFKLYISKIMPESNTSSFVKSWNIERSNELIKTWCLCEESQNIAFIAIWSGGQVVAYDMHGVEPRVVFCISSIKNAIHAAADAVDKHHLAVMMVDEKKNAALDIWDIKFGVRKIRRILKIHPSDKLEMKVVQSVIIFPSIDNDMIMIPVQVEKSTLAAAIGKSFNLPEKEKFNMYTWTEDGKVSAIDVCETDNFYPSSVTADYFFKELLPKLNIKSEFRDYFSYFNAIQESELVKILQLTLRHDYGTSNLPEKEFILNIIFKVPYTDVFLQQHLCKLNFEEVILTLKHLKTILNSEHSGFDSWRPSDKEVVNWMLLLVQTHCQEFYLTGVKDMSSFLNEISDVILKKIKVYEESGKLVCMDISLRKVSNSKYSVETLLL